VFSVFSIFSVKYRPLAKEAFNCVFRTALLRPCETGFDRKLKAKIVASVFEKSPGAAKFVNTHFEALSWIFTIIFFASFAYVVYGVYNLVTVGTCDPVNPENCPLSGSATNQTCDINATFVEFYGAECPHCQKMIPIVEAVENETGATFDKREVWHNETNYGIMLLHKNDIVKSCGVLGVPTFYSMKTKKAVCGEMTKEQLKAFVIANR
jgi:thiol-disulfide isomerase/thioredoxin